MALTRTQINDIVAKMHGSSDLGSGGVLALKEVLNKLNGQTSLIAYKTANQTGIGTVFEDVTETGLAVAANTAYSFEFHVLAFADATTTGIDLACNGPASPTLINYTQAYWGSIGPSLSTRSASAYDNDTGAATSPGTSVALFTVKGIIRNGLNAGTLIARIKREAVPGSTLDVVAGSFGRLDLINEQDG